MVSFVLSPVLSAAVVVAVVVCAVFLLTHLIPGGPVEVMPGEAASPADREALRRALGLDQPILLQLAHDLQGLFERNLGHSLQPRRPIAVMLADRLPATCRERRFFTTKARR